MVFPAVQRGEMRMNIPSAPVVGASPDSMLTARRVVRVRRNADCCSRRRMAWSVFWVKIRAQSTEELKRSNLVMGWRSRLRSSAARTGNEPGTWSAVWRGKEGISHNPFHCLTRRHTPALIAHRIVLMLLSLIRTICNATVYTLIDVRSGEPMQHRKTLIRRLYQHHHQLAHES